MGNDSGCFKGVVIAVFRSIKEMDSVLFIAIAPIRMAKPKVITDQGGRNDLSVSFQFCSSPRIPELGFH